ncbi:14092_t:CDS:2, partial [Racocetra fulgida]
QAYSDYNLSNEPPSIEIKSLINQQKSWAESILIQAVNLFEKPDKEYFDINDSVQETVVIIQSNENEPIYIPNNKDKLKSLDITKEQQG